MCIIWHCFNLCRLYGGTRLINKTKSVRVDLGIACLVYVWNTVTERRQKWRHATDGKKEGEGEKNGEGNKNTRWACGRRPESDYIEGRKYGDWRTKHKGEGGGE